MSATQLFNEQSADGDSEVTDFAGGLSVLQVDGTFGGGTVVLLISLDGGTTWTPTDVSITESEALNISICSTCKIKLNLSGSSGASVSAWLGRSAWW